VHNLTGKKNTEKKRGHEGNSETLHVYGNGTKYHYKGFYEEGGCEEGKRKKRGSESCGGGLNWKLLRAYRPVTMEEDLIVWGGGRAVTRERKGL